MKENFSKKIDIEYNDKIYHYNSVTKAVEKIFEIFKGEFSKPFIYYMINSGKFNINEWLDEYVDNKWIPDLSSRKLMQVNNTERNLSLVKHWNTNLIKQLDIYKLGLDTNKYKGICLLTSIYNAYPKLFDNNIENLKLEIESLSVNDYDKIDKVVKHINTKFKDDLGVDLLKHYISVFGGDIEKIIKDCIDIGIPVALAFSDKLTEGHTVTLVGYDQYNYWIYDNDELNNVDTLIKDILKLFENKLYKTYNAVKNTNKFKTFIRNLSRFNCINITDRLKEFDIKSKLSQLISKKNGFILMNKLLIYQAYDYLDLIYI